MNATLFRLLCLGVLGASALVSADEPLVAVSYNLRYASDKSPNAWPDRRPIMKECLRGLMPDLVGTQEGVYGQLKDLASDLPEYDWVGLGRDGGSRGEFMAIFYKRERFDLLEYDHFWLSDTPETIASATWGNTNRRMVTWGRFRERGTQKEFYFVNTHFDHQVQEAREKSAQLVRERVAQWDTAVPVVLVGDFNAVAGGNPVHATFVGDGFFADTWETAAERKGDPTVNSYNGFQPVLRESRRIDWILVRGPVRADSVEIVEFSRDGQYPSDHFPVVARLRFGEQP